MTKLCVSSIVSARGLLGDHCFKKKPFVDGMESYQLSCLESKDGARFVRTGDSREESEALQEGALLQNWVENGVFDAIDKNYLKSMSLIVAKGQVEKDELGENVLENYSFK